MLLRGLLADRPPYRKFLMVVGITLLCAIIFTLLGSMIAAFLYGVNPMTNPGFLKEVSNPAVVSALKMMQLFSSIGTFIIPPLLAAFLFDIRPMAYLGLERKSKPTVFLLVIVLMFAIVPFINWMLVVNGGMHLPAVMKDMEDWMKASESQAAEITKVFLNSGTITGLILNLFIIAIIPAIGEELLFRGLIQRLFTELSNNVHVAIILSAVLFSALHLQFYGFFPRFALGVMFGYLYLWSGNLWLPMLAHFVNNAAAVLFSWMEARQGLPFNQDTFGTGKGEEMVLAASVFLTWGILFAIHKMLKSDTNSI